MAAQIPIVHSCNDILVTDTQTDKLLCVISVMNSCMFPLQSYNSSSYKTESLDLWQLKFPLCTDKLLRLDHFDGWPCDEQLHVSTAII